MSSASTKTQAYVLVERFNLNCHTLSHLVTPCHTLSHLVTPLSLTAWEVLVKFDFGSKIFYVNISSWKPRVAGKYASQTAGYSDGRF